jgi:hypothetical protein
MAQPLYAAKAMKEFVKITFSCDEQTASIIVDAVHACSKAIWADDFLAEVQLLSAAALHEKRGIIEA